MRGFFYSAAKKRWEQLSLLTKTGKATVAKKIGFHF